MNPKYYLYGKIFCIKIAQNPETTKTWLAVSEKIEKQG